MKTILDEAYAGKYGVPALPAFNEPQIRACIEAAVEANSPLILLTHNGGDPGFTHGIARYFAEQAHVNVALCLDHSRTFEDCVMGIRTGVTAIMADRSTLTYDENAAQVKALADIAHAAGVSIEGELGHVGVGLNYAVDGVTALTEPDAAKRFFDDTGVDALAVAVGTAHGVYVGTPKLDFERLIDINAACGKPLVLHGGSGSGEDNIHRACQLGVAKVNIVTDVLTAAYQAALEGDFTGNAIHRFFPAMSQAIRDTALRMFDVTGSTGKAGAGDKRGGLTADTGSTEEK